MAETLPKVAVTPQPWITSRTILLNAAALVLLILNYLPQWVNPDDGKPVLSAETLAFIAGSVIPILNILLRTATKAPLAGMHEDLPKAVPVFLLGLFLLCFTGTASASQEVQNMNPRLDGMDRPADGLMRRPRIHFLCSATAMDHGTACSQAGCSNAGPAYRNRLGRGRLRGTGAAVLRGAGRAVTASVRAVRARRANGRALFVRRGRSGC